MEDHNQNNIQTQDSQEEDFEYEGEVDTHDVAVAAYNRVDALIELLIKKGVITEDEYDKVEDEVADAAMDDFEEDEEEESADSEPPGNQPGQAPSAGLGNSF